MSIFLKMVQSIQLLMEKLGSVVLVVCQASWFLSYTSTQIPTVGISLTPQHG